MSNNQAINSNNPMVSIIVPVYNREKLVERVINTVKNQSYESWELILIDDSSTDNTKAIIEDFAAKDSRIRCVPNAHKKGPSGGRNTGLDESKGKYIAYQDSDDEWMPHHLQTMVHYLESYPDIDLMSADPLRKYEETGEVFNYDKMDMAQIGHSTIEQAFVINEDELFDKQLRGRVITTQCLVGKASVMRSVRWDEELNAAVDILHNLALCAMPIKVCHVSDYHAVYWAHNDNLTNVSGGHSPQRMERVHNAFALYWQKVLLTMPLNQSQTRYVKEELAKTYVWHLGYHTYEPQGKYAQALACYAKAIALAPTKIKFYVTWFKAFIKRLTRKAPNND